MRAEAAATPAAEVSREVVINDSPAKARIQLTKRSVQEDIQRRTHTVIATRGRYYPPGAEEAGPERPLHLVIRPGFSAGRTIAERQAACDAAAAEVEAIMAGKPPGAAAAAGKNPHQAHVYIGFEAPPSFDLLGKIKGPGGAYLAHIARSSGVAARLVGRGAGGHDEAPEPLNVFISGGDPGKVAEAKA